MRVIHISDTHLGFSSFDIKSESGVNQRELDFYLAFESAVDKIVELKPDFVIHTGDLFHRQSPKNRELTLAIEQFTKLTQAGIKVILIAGNHSRAKSKFISPVLKLFKPLKDIYPVFEKFQKIEFKDIIFYALPHFAQMETLNSEFDRVNSSFKSDKKSILLMHFSIGKNYLMQESGELFFPKEREKELEKFDYVALGHWHKFQKIFENSFYSGSLERTFLSDYDYYIDLDKKRERSKKGFIILDFKDKLEINFEEIESREIYKIAIDCSKLDSIEAIESFLKSIEYKKEPIFDIHFLNLPKSLSIDLKKLKLREIFKSRFININRVYSLGKTLQSAKSSSSNLKLNFESRFREHIENLSNSDTQRDRLYLKISKLIDRGV